MVPKRDPGFWLWVLTCVGWACYLGTQHSMVSLTLAVTAFVSLAWRSYSQEKQLCTLAVEKPLVLPTVLASPYRDAAPSPTLRKRRQKKARSPLLASISLLPRHQALRILLDLPGPSRKMTRGMLMHRMAVLEWLAGRVLLEEHVSGALSAGLLKHLLQNRHVEVQHALLTLMSTDTSQDKPC